MLEIRKEIVDSAGNEISPIHLLDTIDVFQNHCDGVPCTVAVNPFSHTCIFILLTGLAIKKVGPVRSQ
jgi:hypothetical protein